MFEFALYEYKEGFAKFFAFVLCITCVLVLNAQDCSVLKDYTTVCVGSNLSFSASVNGGNARQENPGNNYGCLGSTPNSKWFFFKATKSGKLNIKQTNSNNRDVDGALWGPFESINDIIDKCGHFPYPLQCDYASASYFHFSINAEKGKFYVLLVCNYSRQPTEISLEDSQSTSETDCSPDILVTKSSNLTEFVAGEEVIWSIEVENVGVGDATGVQIKDKLPTGVSYVSHSGGNYDKDTGIWNIGNLSKGGKFTLKIKTKAGQVSAKTEITNSVTAVKLNEEESNNFPDQLSATISVKPNATDFDLDGKPNDIDLDDDNDGILDDDEKDCTIINVPAGGLEFEANSRVTTTSGNYYFNNNNDELILDIGQIAPKGTVINLEYRGATIFSSAIPKVSCSKDNSSYITYKNLPQTNSQWFSAQYILPQDARYVKIKRANISWLYLKKNYTHSAFSLKDCDEVDTDLDGIPNYLDLDSDNDGCPDATEGSKHISNLKSNGAINSAVDGNGIPILSTGGQNIGNSQKSTKVEIATQPQNQTICGSKNVSLSAKAKAISTTVFNGGNPNYNGATTTEQVKYQWQKWNEPTSDWVDISGENGTANSNAKITLDLGMTATNNDKYRIKFTSVSLECPQYSNEATITVKTSTPTFTQPNNVALCVNNIISANFANTTNGNVNTPPDYYEFTEMNKTILDITDVNSECCTTGNTISWKITPTSNGQSLSGTGQPSASLVGKKLWLNVATSNPKSSYTEKQYTITYKVTGCNGNESDEKSTIITIKPRFLVLDKKKSLVTSK